jgi:FixJ family two-component response regulator
MDRADVWNDRAASNCGRGPESTPVTEPARLSIAVVDDDEEVRKALRRLLCSLGHDVHLFGSAEEFEAEPTAADCLILDVRLPGLNGPELLERIRLRGLPIPIVFITGDGEPFSRDTAGQASAPSLAKPFDDIDLMAAITKAMSAARHTR